MQAEADIPPIPSWFASELMALVALYPSATPNRALTLAWWRYLHRQPQAALLDAFARVPQKSPQFMPTAEMVRDLASAWRPPTPRPDLERPALSEPDPELPPELAAIRDKQRRGEITPQEATKAFLRWTADRL
jgi:hypothetical protein